MNLRLTPLFRWVAVRELCASTTPKAQIVRETGQVSGRVFYGGHRATPLKVAATDWFSMTDVAATFIRRREPKDHV
jgi:hypothetical protein